MKIDLKEYICHQPFRNLEIHDGTSYLCCYSWLKKPLPWNKSIEETWNSEEAVEIRKSIVDGSYKYCDSELCPHLSVLLSKGIETGPIFRRSKVPNDVKYYIENEVYKLDTIYKINYAFDRSCNYRCPSCRLDLIMANDKDSIRIENTMNDIEDNWARNTKIIVVTSSGDPFVSKAYRTFLQNFKQENWPNLQKIHLFSNASLWNKKNWESISGVHKYIKSCDISVDAGTKYTYENVTRLGGNWDTLITNLKFIATIPTLREINLNFVVQDTNYFEMHEFVLKMNEIFKGRQKIFFQKITNWGTYTDGQFKLKCVWDETHPDYPYLVEELKKIKDYRNVFHNMFDILDKELKQKSFNLL